MVAPAQYINMGSASLTLSTVHTVDSVNCSFVWVAGSTKVNSGVEADPTGVPISVNYSFSSYTSIIEGVITGLGIQEYCIRLQGLNTANGNAPVIVTHWSYSMNLDKTLD